MDLKHLLSIVTAALTALAAILYSMGAQHALAPVAVWMAAILSLVATDFLGVLRLPRGAGSILMWCALVVFVVHFLLTWDSRIFAGHTPDWQLQNVVNVLMFLQCVLLFQQKDAKAYGWLSVMSLLQVVVAARYSRGAAFGSLLIVYAIVGIFALALLALYAQRSRGRRSSFNPEPTATAGPDTMRRRRWLRVKRGTQDVHADDEHLAERDEHGRRWPLAGAEAEFTSSSLGSGRAGIVPEFFARLSLVIVGGLVLATVIFYAVPRPRIPSWRGGDMQRSVSVVGFNDKISLGWLGDTIESREEVMRVRLLDAATREPYSLWDNEAYLRGTVANWYFHNQWHRPPPPGYREDGRLPADPGEQPEVDTDAAVGASASLLRIGSPVIQQTTLEPYFERLDLFFIWPLIEPVDETQDLRYDPLSERLSRRQHFHYTAPLGELSFEVLTSGLADGRQVPLVPARRKVRQQTLLQMPGGDWSLPRLSALAANWRREAGLAPDQHEKIAHLFQRQLSSSGQFHYSLEPVERDGSIDAIEDFVSNHPSGHCEYFATALAMMLRSQGIPSRVVLGYRCDEWDSGDKCFQVRQLHAHAWVEAFLDPAHLDLASIPQPLRDNDPRRWSFGGWLRLDPTPGDDVGSTAANRTAWGALEARLHALQHFWERNIAEMDNQKQRESIYEPIRRAASELARRLFSWSAWRETLAGAWDILARMFRSGIIGKLIGGGVLIGATLAIGLAGWRLTRLAVWLWRRLFGNTGSRSSKARASVEFYRHFEQVAAECGLMRRPGNTPREFARVAGARLATLSGRPELAVRAIEVAEAFYVVRFGRQELDGATAASIRQALEELSIVNAKRKRGIS